MSPIADPRSVVSDLWPTESGGAPPTVASTPPEWNGWGAPTRPPAYGEQQFVPTEPPPLPTGLDRRQWLIVAGVVVGVFVLVIGTLLWMRRSTDQTAAPTSTSTTVSSSTSALSTTTPTTAKPSTTAPGGTAAPSTIPSPATSGPPMTQADLDAAVVDARAFVEQKRGVVLASPVPARLLSDDEFDKQVAAAQADRKVRLQRQARVLGPFFIAAGSPSQDKQFDTVMTASLVAFFDPASRTMLVRTRALTPLVRSQLVHELTRAVDDQIAPLVRPELRDRKDESSFGLEAVVQGDAARITQLYVEAQSDADRGAIDRERATFDTSLRSLPTSLVQIAEAPGQLGRLFVTQLLGAGGDAQLAAAVKTPPTSSEQVMHIVAFQSGEIGTAVQKPTPDGKLTDEGVLGEFDLALVLAQTIDPNEATKAAKGWGGDWYVTWNDPQKGSCARVNIAMDTTEDRAELKSAFETWASKHPAATVKSLGPNLLQVTSCASGGGGGGSSPL